MKYLHILLSLAAVASGAALRDSSSEPGAALPMGEMGWSGRITPGGPIVKVWGDDLDDIEAKIKKDHPDFSMYLDEPIETSENPFIEARHALTKRLNGNCDSKFGDADVGGLNDGISALRGVSAGCSARARTCIRTQCKRGTGIGLCNDNYHDITVKCTDTANMGDAIRWGCVFTRPGNPLGCSPGQVCPLDQWTHGQEFATSGNWNVIVGTCNWLGASRPV